MYYIKGEMIHVGEQTFYPRTIEFFKDALHWCETNIGPAGTEWFYIDANNVNLLGNTYSLPLYIGILDDQDVLLFKIAFPHAYIEHSSY